MLYGDGSPPTFETIVRSNGSKILHSSGSRLATQGEDTPAYFPPGESLNSLGVEGPVYGYSSHVINPDWSAQGSRWVGDTYNGYYEPYTYAYKEEFVQIKPLKFIPSPQNPSGSMYFTLEAFRNGSSVFKKTQPGACPTVVFYPDKKTSTCPPNTCQVDCDTHYCCYGSDGIAVTSFLK